VDRQVNLVNEGVDLVLRIGNLPDSSLVAIKVGADVLRVVAAAPSYLADHARIDANGLGVTRLYSFHVADKVRDKELQIVLAHAEPAPVAVHLVAQRFRMPVPKVRAFIDFAVPRLRAELSRSGSEASQMEIVEVHE
jgi:DNA-binding transcriptional LysR family regulator